MLIARGVGYVPEHVQRAVNHGRRERYSHQRIFDEFDREDDQRAAAALLSLTPEAENRHRFRWMNRLLVFLLALVALSAVMSMEHATYLIGLAIAVAIVVMVKRRNPWGYNAAILMGVWGIADTVLVAGQTVPDDQAGVLLVLTLWIAIAAIAYRLRTTLFPWFRILGIRVDESGAPALLAQLLEESQRRIPRRPQVGFVPFVPAPPAPSPPEEPELTPDEFVALKIKERWSNEEIQTELIAHGMEEDEVAALVKAVVKRQRSAGGRTMFMGILYGAGGLAVMIGMHSYEGGDILMAAGFLSIAFGVFQFFRGLIQWGSD